MAVHVRVMPSITSRSTVKPPHTNAISINPCVIGTTIWESIVPVSHRIFGIVIARLSLPAHIGSENADFNCKTSLLILHPSSCEVHNLHSSGLQSLASMFNKHQKQLGRDMYPTRQVIHKLRASHNIKVPDVDMLILVRHGLSLQSGYVNIH